MKQKWLVMLIVIFTTILNGGFVFSATNEAVSAPKAVVLEPEFEFKSVPAGSIMVHDFIIKNEGTAVLDIVKVKPG